MPHKEFIKLMEENILLFDKMADRLKMDPTHLSGYPRQQMTVLVRLNLGGRARLKDIARREQVSAPNLCASFRKLERDGLVSRVIDENDRRNTWYAVTPAGVRLADKIMDNFRQGIDSMFSVLSRSDEEQLTAALKVVNTIFKKME